MKKLLLLLPAMVLWMISLLILSGCGDAAHWYSRNFYGVDCRPEKLQAGYCVPAKKGASHAQTATP